MEHPVHHGEPRPKKASPAPFFWEELANLLRRPQRILFLWNWKAAWLSILLRGPIFTVAAVQRGLGATVSALLAECLFCATTAGFYGAVVQIMRNAEPEWLTIVFLTVVLPAVFQGLEFLLHWLHGTPHLRLAEIASLIVSAISALFNWYAMRRGTLLVGGEGSSFGSDLRCLPGLIWNFLSALPRRWAARERNRSSKFCCQAPGDS